MTDPHEYVRHWDNRPGCAACGAVKSDAIHRPARSTP